MIWQELWLIQEKHEPILGDVRCALKHLKTLASTQERPLGFLQLDPVAT